MLSRVDEEKALVIRKSAQVHCGILGESWGLHRCLTIVHTQGKTWLHLSDPHRFLPGVIESHAQIFHDWGAAHLLGSLPSGMRTVFQHLASQIPCAVPAQSRCLSTAADFLPLPQTGLCLRLEGLHLPALSRVASTMLHLLVAAGGFFKKLSDSFGSDNSFQGDLEERKCDTNLTQIPNFFFF